MQTLSEFLTAHPLRFAAHPARRNRNMPDWDAGAHHWRCVLANEADHRMTVPFSQGSAHRKPPTVEDVLDCLASDSAGVENARDFWDWAEEYGYLGGTGEDARKAERTYKACVRQSEGLKELVGAAYDDLLWKTERE